MLKEIQHTRAVTGRERDALMARDALLRCRQRPPHDEAGEIQPFVCGGCREHALLLTRGTKLDAIVAGGRGCRHGREPPIDRVLYGQSTDKCLAVKESAFMRLVEAAGNQAWRSQSRPKWLAQPKRATDWVARLRQGYVEPTFA